MLIVIDFPPQCETLECSLKPARGVFEFQWRYVNGGRMVVVGELPVGLMRTGLPEELATGRFGRLQIRDGLTVGLPRR